MSTDEGVLEELDMVLIGIDRPTYGLSDPDPDRQDVCSGHACLCSFIDVVKQLWG